MRARVIAASARGPADSWAALLTTSFWNSSAVSGSDSVDAVAAPLVR